MANTVRRRFAFTLGANLVRTLVSFATGMMLARWLGPASYGSMAFLLGTFLAVRQLLDMGTSTAFFTFLSQRHRSKQFVLWFFVWLGAQLILSVVVVGILMPKEWIQLIWRGEPRGVVLLALVAAFMQNSLWPAVQQAAESQRKTLFVQRVGTVVVLAHLSAVVVLRWSGRLGVYVVFAVIALEYFVASVVAQQNLSYANGDGSGRSEAPAEPTLRKYLRYCLPLIPYSWLGFAYVFVDRWLLQTYGGGIEQAYYAVGAQFAAIALIATTSILNIFWKEVAEAHHEENHARANMLYVRVSRMLFLLGAIFAGFLLPWSGELLRLLLGAAYVGGTATLAIMFLYPVHQSMGQIGGTMLYATERVTLQVVTGIGFMIASMGLTYLVLAPRGATIPGLGLASEGLAIKMVVMQIIQVNTVAYMIARDRSSHFDWAYQVIGLGGCLLLGWAVHLIATEFWWQTWPLPLLLGLGAVLYGILVCGFVYVNPWLTGFTRDELAIDLRRGWQVLTTSDKYGRVQR